MATRAGKDEYVSWEGGTRKDAEDRWRDCPNARRKTALL